VAPAAFLAAVAFLLWAFSASGMLDGWRGPEAVSRPTTTATTVLSLVGEDGGAPGTTAPASTTTPPSTAPSTTAAPAATPPSRPQTTTSAGPAPGGTYVIKPGDSPVSIAEAHGVSVQDLMELNDIADPTELRVGATLRIPSAD
jgi:LysM repeat protein